MRLDLSKMPEGWYLLEEKVRFDWVLVKKACVAT